MVYKVFGYLLLGFLMFCWYHMIFTDVDWDTALPFIGLFASYGFVATLIAAIYLINGGDKSATG
jgi:hypothetical protein